MKVKNRNLLELALQVLTLVLAFIPGFYKVEDWADSTEYLPKLKRSIPIQVLESRHYQSLLDGLFNTSTLPMILGFLLFATILCGIVFYVVQFLASAEKRNWMPTWIAAGAQLLLFAVYSVCIETCDFTYSDRECLYSLHILFYAMLLILIALAVLTLLGYRRAARFGILEEYPSMMKVEIVSKPNNDSEIQKYQALYDQGVITKEVFETIKAQLLNCYDDYLKYQDLYKRGVITEEVFETIKR